MRSIPRTHHQEPSVQLSPVGENLLVGASARPNEVTYSEDWMRPDYVPPQASAPSPADAGPLAAESTAATDPGKGLPA